MPLLAVSRRVTGALGSVGLPLNRQTPAPCFATVSQSGRSGTVSSGSGKPVVRTPSAPTKTLPPTTSSAPTQTLPATGSDVNATLATALVIRPAGTVLLAVDRRRLRRIRP